MIRFWTLGSIDLQLGDGQPLHSVLAQPKRVALLSYLALAQPHGFHRRDRLLAMFWPEQDEPHARDSLNQATRFFRQNLGANVIVSRGADEIGIDWSEFWCDAVEFRSSVAHDHHDNALQLYQGHLMDGFFVAGAGAFEEWVERERAKLRQSAANAARAMADHEEAAGRVAEALRWGQLAVEFSETDERTLRRWLALLASAGDRAAAMQAYDAFARRLREQYDAEPSSETQALVEQIRCGTPTGGHQSPLGTPDVVNVVPTTNAVVRPEPAPTVERQPVAGERPRARALAFDAAVVCTVLAVATWTGVRSARATSAFDVPTVSTPASGFNARSIAIDAFRDATGGRLRHVADGLTRFVGAQLRADPLLIVSPPSVTAMLRNGVDIGVDPAVRQLKVGRLLSGTVSTLGSVTHVKLDLIDALTGELIASVDVGSREGEWVALEDSVGAAVAQLAQRYLGQSVETRIPTAGTRSAAAWEAMQRLRRQLSVVDSLTGVLAGAEVIAQVAATDAALAAVSALDTLWVEPVIERARLGERAVRAAALSFGDTIPTRAMGESMQYAERAVRLAPNNPRALRARATLRMLVALQRNDSAQLSSAERDLRRALDADSRDAATWAVLSELLQTTGRATNASAALDNAIRLDSLNSEVQWPMHLMARIALRYGNVEETRRRCQEGRRRFPNTSLFAECELRAAGLPGAKPDMPNVWKLRDAFVRVSPSEHVKLARLRGNMHVALAFVRAGQIEDGKALAAMSLGDSIVDPQRQLLRFAAIVYAQAYDATSAIDLLQRYLHENKTAASTLGLTGRTWMFAPIAGDPRFQQLVAVK